MGAPLGDSTTAPMISMAGLSATGTPSSSNYLREDGTWNSPAGNGTVTSVAMTEAGDLERASNIASTEEKILE